MIINLNHPVTALLGQRNGLRRVAKASPLEKCQVLTDVTSLGGGCEYRGRSEWAFANVRMNPEAWGSGRQV